MSEWWPVGVAIYAAIVATGALFLEVRRWVEGQARLVVSATLGMATFNLPGTEGNRYLVVNVTNRGGSPTTLTTLGLLERLAERTHFLMFLIEEGNGWERRWMTMSCVSGLAVGDSTLPSTPHIRTGRHLGI